MQKVTVSQEASDRKWNRHIPKKEGLPSAEKKFFLIKGLPLWLKGPVSPCLWWEDHVPAKSRTWLRDASLLVTAFAKLTHWTRDDLQTSNCWKWFNNILQRLFGETWLFLMVQGNIPNLRKVKNPKWKFESKGILASFLPLLILLLLRQTKRRQVNEVKRRKKGVRYEPQNFSTKSTIHVYHDK